MNAVKQFRDFISNTNLRMTRERKTIIEAVLKVQQHFTVSYLVESMAAEGNHISTSTVYRLIPHLLQARLIQKAPVSDCSDEQVYERVFDRPHHDHLICDICGEVIEFEDNDIEDLQQKVAQRHGYRLSRHILELHGVCPKCQDRIVEKAVNPL